MPGNSEIEIFTEALGLPHEDRQSYLDLACAHDAVLRARLETLLREHESAGSFLENSPISSIDEARAKVSAGERPGDRVDRYKLLQQIGEGGCGVVFMAEQETPVRRRVALKIIKPGMDTKSVVARFEAERQALALMDHPNIAKVFDAGSTASGRPFFVMELVRGIRITDYCDQHSLTTGQRLELFIQVCHAVQHAHQKGIIHRDLKPSNILVTQGLDGDAVPVVIDFGVAKATTNQPLTDKTLFTAFEMLIGTPTYMSPEQAAYASVDVDTRTDIYSLGVLLYELLTGLTPFDSNALLKVGLDEIRRVIREEEPMRPSTRLLKRMSSEDITSIAHHRGSEPLHLIRNLSGDLDWIVMKALEKDRRRRYETANGMAMDVKRLLTNEAVIARPPSRIYRLKKTLQRHRWFFLSLSAIATVVLIALGAVSISLARERKARLEGEAALSQSKNVTRLLEEMLEGAGPSAANGRDAAMLRDILDRTAQRIGSEFAAQPAVEAELRNLIASLYLDIGKYEDAEKMDQAALALELRVYGSESPQVAASFYHLGRDYWKEGKLDPAEQAQSQALSIRQRLFTGDNADIAASLSALGSVYTDQKKLVQAEPIIRQGLDMRRQLFQTNNLDVADSLQSLCLLLEAEGLWAEAESNSQQLVEMCRQFPNRGDLLAEALDSLAYSAGYNGDNDLQESAHEEAFAIKSKFLPEEHPYVAKSIADLGEVLRLHGKTIEAHAVLLAAISIQTKLLGEDYPDTIASLGSLTQLLETEGKWDEAESVQRKGLSLSLKRLGYENGRTIWEFSELSHVLIAEGKFDEAWQSLNEILSSKAGLTSDAIPLWGEEIELLGRKGRWQEAATANASLIKLEPDNSYHYYRQAALLVVMHDYVGYTNLCRQALGKFSALTDAHAAQRIADDCLLLPNSGVDSQLVDTLANRAVTNGASDDAMGVFDACKALSEYRQGHFPEAALWTSNSLNSADSMARAQGYAVLAMAQWQMDKKAAAKTALASGLRLVPSLSPHSEKTDLGQDWLDLLFARLMLDEAATLVQPADAASQ